MDDAQRKELMALTTEALREFINPVQILNLTPANGGVSGVFRSGARLFDYRVTGSGVSYRPRPVAGMRAAKKDSLSPKEIRQQARDRYLSKLRSRLNA